LFRCCSSDSLRTICPPGSTIIVEVPVAPAVYRRLRRQAEAGGQTPAQFMGSILTAAAGKEELK
jgi:hypothetical protein